MEVKEVILDYVKKYPKRFLLQLKQNKEVLIEVRNLMELYPLDFKLCIYWLGRNISPICKYNKVKTYRGFNDPLKFCGLKSKCKCNKESAKVKTKETNLKRYGDENYVNITKAKKTKLQRYGDENYNNRSKAIDTNLEKFGETHFSKTNICKDIVKKTNLERYGVESYSQQHISKETLAKLNNATWLMEQHHNQQKSLVQIADEIAVTDSTVNGYFCKNNIKKYIYNSSYPEKLIVEHIQETYNTEVITNIRTIIEPKELDIFLPEYNLAIEYNGIYWHRPEIYGSKEDWFKYHQNKIDLCNKKGIKLLHLWENFGDHNTLLDDAISSIIDNNLEKIFKEIYNN